MEPKDNHLENAEAPVKPIEAPTGLELHPAPKQSVRLNRRASIGVGAIALWRPRKFVAAPKHAGRAASTQPNECKP